MPKVLVSPGYGAGWSTWNSKPKEVAEYKPIIEFIENGGNFKEIDEDHELIKQMKKDLDISHICCLADRLVVEEVTGLYRINEYDGHETIQTSIDFW